MTIEEYRKEVGELVGRMMALCYSMTVLAVGIGLLGIANSLFASVLDRIRESGILRAAGVTRRQVTLSIVIEGGIVGLVAAILAIPLGPLFGSCGLGIQIRDMFGTTVFLVLPWLPIAFAFAAAIVLAGLARYLPGRYGSSLQITRALQHESGLV